MDTKVNHDQDGSVECLQVFMQLYMNRFAARWENVCAGGCGSQPDELSPMQELQQLVLAAFLALKEQTQSQTWMLAMKGVTCNCCS
jgi:hypothetical protein